MREETSVGQRVQFLPAARLPATLFDQLDGALEELLVVFFPNYPVAAWRLDRAAETIIGLRSTLRRHRGTAGEPCLVTKEAVFELSEGLIEAASLFADWGMRAARLVVIAVDDRLVEQIVETQPIAPA